MPAPQGIKADQSGFPDLPPRAAAAGAQRLLVARADERGVDLDFGGHAVRAHLRVQPERRVRIARRRARCGARTREQPSGAHRQKCQGAWQHRAVQRAAPQDLCMANVRCQMRCMAH